MREASLMVSLDSTRFDSRLSPMSRIFYAEVCGNVTVDSGCPVNDEYFASLYGVSSRQVRTWRTELKKYGYTKEQTDKLGFKHILPTKFDYEEQINSLKVQKTLKATYFAPGGQRIENSDDALKYFQPLIESSGIPQTFQTNTRKFFNVLSNILFDLEYFHKQFSNFETTFDFFQFVIQTIKPVDIYQQAETIFLDNYSNIRQLGYYIVGVLVKTYKDEFMSTSRRKFLMARRKSVQEAKLQDKHLETLRQNNKLKLKQSEALKDKIEKQIKEESRRHEEMD